MRSRRNFLVFAAAVLGILLLALVLRQPIARQVTSDGKNVFLESDYQLTGVHTGDLVVFGDTLVLDTESRVSGNTSLIGDTITIAGTVDGELSAVGGTLTIGETARLGSANLMGESVTVGGTLTGDLRVSAEHVILLPAAQFNGVIDICSANVDDQRIGVSAVTCTNDGFNPFAALIAIRQTSFDGSTLGGRMDTLALLGVTIVGMLILTGISVLSVTFFPRQISHIEEAMRARPRSFGGVGVATYALALGIFLAMIVLLALVPPLGLLLVPVYLILLLLLFALTVIGLVTAVIMFGDWLLRRASKLPSPPLIAAVVGSFALSLALAVVALLPFGFAINFVLLAALSCVGLGASLSTRIGTRPVGRTYFVQG